MTEKVTIMILKVDLQCSCCYKKIKKLLCKFPQIRDQVYDEKKNTVTITVICCSPEKIRDKLCCKGGKTIQSIEIKDPPKPKDKEPAKPKPNTEEQKPKSNGKVEDPKPNPPPPSKEDPKPNPPPPAKKDPKPNPPPAVIPVYPAAGYPIGVCCGPCSEGISGGPCYHGFGRPLPPPPPCYPPRRPCYCYGRPCNTTICVCYTEGNPSACRVM